MRIHQRAAVMIALSGLVAASLALPARAAATHPATGAIDSVVRVGNDIRVTGWAGDADTRSPATVNVSVDGHRVGRTTANVVRSGIANGFAVVVSGTAGTHRVCATVVDYPSTTKLVLIGCRTIVLDHDPIGVLSAVTQAPGTLTATGWAIDRDTPKRALSVVIRVDGHPVIRAVADQPVTGLDRSHPLAGADHGFAITFPITEGTHRICAKLLNTGPGWDKTLTCRDPFTVDFSPHGAIYGLTQVPGGFSIVGSAQDPDTTATTTVTVTADGTAVGTAAANQPRTGYTFRGTFLLGSQKLAAGPRTICVIANNLGAYGRTKQVACRTQNFNWNPTGGLDKITQKSPGALVTGWAIDPDNGKTEAIKARITEVTTSGTTRLATVLAGAATGSHPGHSFSAVVPLPDGVHKICVTAINLHYGNANSVPACSTVTLKFEPYGAFETVARDTRSTDVVATGWTIDPDTSASITVQVSIDGGTPTLASANVNRADIAKRYPGTGSYHGYVVHVAATAVEHRVCVRAVNVMGGTGTTPLGCRIVNAVHPKVASAPTAVGAIGGYGGARITWTPPTSDGGAPWSGYTIRALPGGPSMTVGPAVQTATLLGLSPSTRYSFSVVANNVAGMSAAGVSPVVTTQKQPPAQTSPAPISTSRYIRNVYGASGADLATMRAEGAADAKRNPSGHGYLVMLAVGGQDESRNGLILTAGIRYVSYVDMVKDLQAYVDGYASQQRPSAPVTLAIATNNDIDVYRASGVHFANRVIDPVLNYAKRYPGITIAGSDDMEPGFRASYASTRAWLQGFLAATSAPIVFTGSADGCAWTYTNGACNNGWTAAGLYYLSGGAYSIRMIDMPQIYNYTMAQQWRYISLTGVNSGGQKINFGGGLTEYTACAQAGSCGSLTAPTAWRYLWTELRAEPKLRPTSLPYSTDLRIDS